MTKSSETFDIYFGWAKPCSCSWHLCSRDLWFYDSGRLGRVEIVTPTVGARAKEGNGGGEGEKKNTAFSLLSPCPLSAPFDSPHLLLSSGSFNMALSRANCALKENACTVGYVWHSMDLKGSELHFKFLKFLTSGGHCWRRRVGTQPDGHQHGGRKPTDLSLSFATKVWIHLSRNS